jgi:hypothetical protein
LPVLGEVTHDRVELSAGARERYRQQWGSSFSGDATSPDNQANDHDRRQREIAELQDPERWDGLA